MRELPSGTVTFLFTDIDGSTRLLHELGERYVEVLAEHRRLLREAFEAQGGVEVDTQGDAFFVAFPRAQGALAAAAAAQAALGAGPVRVRMGIHTGEPMVTDEGYVGMAVHRGARVMSAGHGGQVLVSEATQRLCGEGFELLDLGPQRLKDMTEPQHLYQLGAGEFPPLKSLNRTNLPVTGSPLVGREAELERLLALLRDGLRAVTLTGTGGSGKTRLALQAAAELVGEFRDGVFWVPLAGLRDPDLVLASIAEALGVREELALYLAEREALLVLDNFEQVIDAAGSLAELLAACPRVKALVTSRAPLHVDAEQEFPLDPLAKEEGVMLFVERARAAGRHLEADGTVAEICRRLDNLPLALELAAARTKLLAPEALLARLERRLPLLIGGRRDAPERQRTLRATIEWSYELLDPETRLLFARLSVFAGNFSLAAAEVVCDADLDALSTIVDLSLLKPIGDDRFLMLETIREYAADQLTTTQDAAQANAGHAEFFLTLAEATVDVRGGALGASHDALHRDQDNLRAALAWLQRTDDSERLVRFVAALADYWDMRSLLAEASSWYAEALARSEGVSLIREKLLSGAAWTAVELGQLERARELTEQRLVIARTLERSDKVASGTMTMAEIYWLGGDLARARELFEEAIALARRVDSLELDALLGAYGCFLEQLGEFDAAEAVLREALDIARRLDRRDAVSCWLYDLAALALDRGDIGHAEALFIESLQLGREVSYLAVQSGCLRGLAGVANASGSFERAVPLLAAAATLRASVGRVEVGIELQRTERTIADARAALDELVFEQLWQEGEQLATETAIEYAFTDVLPTPSRNKAALRLPG